MTWTAERSHFTNNTSNNVETQNLQTDLHLLFTGGLSNNRLSAPDDLSKCCPVDGAAANFFSFNWVICFIAHSLEVEKNPLHLK